MINNGYSSDPYPYRSNFAWDCISHASFKDGIHCQSSNQNRLNSIKYRQGGFMRFL